MHACVRTFICISLCPYKVALCVRTSGVHACMGMGCVFGFPHNARIRSYFDAGIARDQLYYRFSTLNLCQIDSAVCVDILSSFLLSDTMSEFNSDEYGLSEKKNSIILRRVCVFSCVHSRR